jgi:hypothetical protein
MVTTRCLRAHDLEPGLAIGIVAMGFIEGAKASLFPLK